MKKFLVLGISLVLLAVFSVSAIAAPNGFVSSPTGQDAPGLIEFTNSDPNCKGDVIITPYSEKDTLDDDAKEKFDDAYNSIVGADDLADLSDDLKNAADEKGVKDGNLAVSDLFNVDFECDEHDGHGNFNIKIEPETLKNFVALMYYDGDEWVMADDVKVDGKTLSFTLNNPAPMAIFVNAGADNISSPQTGDSFPWIYVGIIAVCVAGLVVVILKLKKKEA